MTSLFAILFFFASAYISDLTTLAWHRARRSAHISRTANLSMALEAISWAPILLAVTASGPVTWACCVASILGSRWGTARGMRRDQNTAHK